MYKLVEESDAIAFTVAIKLELKTQFWKGCAWVGDADEEWFQCECVSDHDGDENKAMRVAIAKAARVLRKE